MGTVVKTYAGYKNVKLIDSGGFGNVYQYSNQRAVKEEFKVIIYCVRIYSVLIYWWLAILAAIDYW